MIFFVSGFISKIDCMGKCSIFIKYVHLIRTPVYSLSGAKNDGRFANDSDFHGKIVGTYGTGNFAGNVHVAKHRWLLLYQPCFRNVFRGERRDGRTDHTRQAPNDFRSTK